MRKTPQDAIVGPGEIFIWKLAKSGGGFRSRLLMDPQPSFLLRLMAGGVFFWGRNS
jgi:hypothetical protein